MSYKVKYEFIFIHELSGQPQINPSQSGSAFFSRLPCKGEYITVWVNKDENYSGYVDKVFHDVKDCDYPDEDIEDEYIEFEKVQTRIIIILDNYTNFNTIE